MDSPIYKNFYKNVCIPLFKNKDIFDGLKILYDPHKFKEFKDLIGITSDNLDIILHSFRYFINQINFKNKNIYNLIYNNRFSKDEIDKNYYPGNDIKNIPIYSIYSKIINHFEKKPNDGCFVCLCDYGGCYHNIKGGIPDKEYLNLMCSNCYQKIGFSKNGENNIKIVKRYNYFRIFKTKEEFLNKIMINYNCMDLDTFKEKYIITKFKKEKGITVSDEDFFKKDTKIVRNLSQISYRILNYILYSHIFFSSLYNKNEELNDYLPKNMSWIKLLTECWEMIKIELKKNGIISIYNFMNYIFLDLFPKLNNKSNINNYDDFINFENELDALILAKINEFKDVEKKTNKLSEFNKNDKISFEDMLTENYNKLNQDEYPFYNYFYFSDYINEDYLLNILNHSDKNKYPVLLKLLESRNSKKTKNLYSLENLPLYNEVLNLFNDNYYLIKRDKAKTLKLKDIKDEDIYKNNKDSINKFITFFNNLKIKNETNNKIMELSEENSLCDFFIDNNNDFGKCYKNIYKKFITAQNNEISGLLDNKIENGIFEANCKLKINIQSANPNEIFITNLKEKFSLIEIMFNSSYRKYAIDENYRSYNQIEVDLDQIENRVTEILLRNKKMFNDTITSFVYMNEDLELKNKGIISSFIENYGIGDNNIDIGDEKILYKFYKENKENNILLLETIFYDFIQLIIFLNYNKKLLKEKSNKAVILKDDSKIYETFPIIDTKISENFKTLFNEKDSFIIIKTSNLFEYYRNLIFNKIKIEFKKYQKDMEEEKKELIETYFKEQNIITKEVFNSAIRNFIVLFLNQEKNKENKIKNNQNNIINYLKISDIWNKKIYDNINFENELDKFEKINIKINQILSLYDYLGDNINDDYFNNVKKAIEREEEAKLAEEMNEERSDIDESEHDYSDDDNVERDYI